MLDVTDQDAIDVWFDVARGRVVAFSVNHRAFVHGGWHEVVRYDTAHERLHVHEFWPPGQERVIPMPSPASEDYTIPLDRALDDLVANWRGYRSRTEAKL